jgi:cbb3-type cytochrome oxidase maturation protein
MSVVFIVLPLALLVVFAAVLAYTWAARRGQFDDLTTPAMRMLHEDEGAPRSGEEREPQARDDANDEVGADAQERRPEPPDRA